MLYIAQPGLGACPALHPPPPHESGERGPIPKCDVTGAARLVLCTVPYETPRLGGSARPLCICIEVILGPAQYWEGGGGRGEQKASEDHAVYSKSSPHAVLDQLFGIMHLKLLPQD